MNENEEYVIEESKDVALVVLNQTWQVPGKINIIYYQTSDSKVDFLYAIGKASGFGPSSYSMIQEHEEIPVITITDRPSDVSTLKHKENGKQSGSAFDRAGEPQSQPQRKGKLNAAGQQSQQHNILQCTPDIDGFAGKELNVILDADVFRRSEPVPFREAVRKRHDDRRNKNTDKKNQRRKKEQKDIQLVA